MSEDLVGRYTVDLNLRGITDKAGLMERVADALDLPEWFGRNWDALLDSLCDTTVWPPQAVERGLLIVVRDWHTFAEKNPREWRIAGDVLSEAVDRTFLLDVVLALGGNAHL
ncbi:barstar family protein [Streptomyces sp. NPDC005435]|uniref:barstar family protein n=1 Tax=Streptomyces sp. NPDC005435 TaxID=3154464 RepID=UPI00345439E2